MTRLVDLQLVDVARGAVEVSADMLSGMHQLTRLVLRPCESLEFSGLDGKTQLQHLALELHISSVQVAQLLSHLQHMQQLTYLSLDRSLKSDDEVNPPAAAYSALTASSKLAHLDICGCNVPAGAWQHIFPTGRQLPHLHTLYLACLRQPSGCEGIPPTGSSLVSCCPNLQALDMQEVQYSAELLAARADWADLPTLGSP